MRQAEATGELTASERRELQAILSRLDAAAALPISRSLSEFRSMADQAADEMARAYAIRAEAERRAVETAARASELDAIDRACSRDLTKLTDQALLDQAARVRAGLLELRRTLAVGGRTAADATAQRFASEKALDELFSAQSALNSVTYVADLSRIGIDCRNEVVDMQQQIRLQPGQAQALRRDFETRIKARIAGAAEQLRQKEAGEAAARYAQWSEMNGRLDEARAAAETALRASKAEAPDAARAVEQTLEDLSAAVKGLGERWTPAGVEPAFAGLDASLAALADAVASRQKVRDEVARRADQHAERLRAMLKGVPDVDGAQVQDVENDLAGLRKMASVAEVERRSREIEADISALVADATKPRPDLSAQDAVVAALTRLGEARGATWDEQTFEQLRSATLGESVFVSGRFDEDGSAINLIVRLSRDVTAVEDAAGTNVDIECHDGEGRACDLVKELPRELYRTEAFAEAKGHAGFEDGSGYEWEEVYDERTADTASADGARAATARELAR